MDDYFVPMTWDEIELLGQKGIGALGIRTYMVIKMRAYGHRTKSWSSQTRIRKDLALKSGEMPSLRGVQKAIKALKDAGLIKSKTRGSSSGTNEYTITSKLVPEQKYDTRNDSTNKSSSDTSNKSDSDTPNKSSSKKEEINLIYYNNKGNVEYILLKGKEYKIEEVLCNIIDEPDTFFMTHSDDDIQHIKNVLRSLENPDSLVVKAVEVIVTF